MSDPTDRLTAIQRTIRSDLEGEIADRRARADAERTLYALGVRDFRDEAEAEAREKGVETMRVALLGEPETALRDIVYVTYTVTERTAGKHDKIDEYLRKLLAKTGLSEYFSAEARSSVHEEEETKEGERVEVMFVRHAHTHTSLKRARVFPVGREAEEEEGGGRGGRF